MTFLELLWTSATLGTFDLNGWFIVYPPLMVCQYNYKTTANGCIFTLFIDFFKTSMNGCVIDTFWF